MPPESQTQEIKKEIKSVQEKARPLLSASPWPPGFGEVNVVNSSTSSLRPALPQHVTYAFGLRHPSVPPGEPRTDSEDMTLASSQLLCLQRKRQERQPLHQILFYFGSLSAFTPSPPWPTYHLTSGPVTLAGRGVGADLKSPHC